MMVKVESERLPRGDIGPCEHTDCAARADCCLTLVVGGIRAYTWVCYDHRGEFIPDRVAA